MRRLLLSTAGLATPFMVPQRNDMAADRIGVSRACLGRDPVVLRHPWDGHVIYVQGEPDNWRQLLEQADSIAMAADAKRMGRIH